MAVQVVMPQLGESIVEGTVAKWLVKEGDTVEKDQPLLEVSTDKVDTELPAPVAGVIGKILVPEGETVDVGTPLVMIEEAATETAAGAGEAPKAAAAARPESTTPPPKPAAAAAVGASAKPAAAAEAPSGPAAKEMPAAPTVKEAPTPLHPPKPHPAARPRITGGLGRARVSPLVRRMAEEHAIDLSQVPGTGIEGRVTKQDVLAFLAKPQEAQRARIAPATPAAAKAPPAKAAGPERAKTGAPSAKLPPEFEDYVLVPKFRMRPYELQPGDEAVPFSRIRKLTADHMLYSHIIAPRVTTVAEVNMARVAEIRNRHKGALKEEGVSLTFLPFLIAALTRALRDYPALNASVEGETLIIKRAVNVGVAVDTERGLLVPVIHNANEKSLLGLARALQDLADRARTKTITPDDMTGGTIAVSNPGREGNLFGTPVINQPHVVILRMGEVVKRPVVVEREGEDLIAIRPMMYLALTYDHRVIDGAVGNGCLYRVKEILEEGDFDL
jgi:pyruvate/2-oxoglutarate dehydrogenase complex dihydrolipoamide acyltransferase (E2) component